VFSFVSAVNSMRSGIESTGCILVDDAKAASLDEDPSHEVTSAQVPTEGKRNLSKKEQAPGSA